MPGTHEVVFALTAPQRAIWLDQALYPGKPIYNIGQTVTINGNLDANRFVEALRQLARETDVLRLGVRIDGDTAQQWVHPYTECAIDRFDFISAPDPTAAAAQWIDEEFWRPIGSTDFPLFRFALLRLGSQRHLWFQKYHHLIADATARRLITVRASQIYEALANGGVPPAAPGGSFFDVIDAENAYLRSATYGADRQYWLDRFAALPDPLFDRDWRQSERARSGRPARLTAKIERRHYQRLAEIARSRGSTTFKAVVALVHVAFSRLYGKSDLVFGVPLANRATPFHATIGLFAQTMPFRIDIPRLATLAEALTLIDVALAKDLSHRRFPFYTLGSDLHLTRQGRGSLYDVSINFLTSNYGFNIAGAPIEAVNLSSGFFTRWAITVADLGAASGVDLIVDYDPGLVEAEEAAQLVRSLGFLLERGLDDLALPVVRVPIMATPDRERLLTKGAPTAVALTPDATTLTRLCEEQAARTPDAVAVICGGDEIRFAALHERAGQLARRLMMMGIGPDKIVGIALPRSIDLVVAVLGVHKAGGAYLPLDPAYPNDRIDYIIGDARALVIVTNAAFAERLPRTSATVLLIETLDRVDDADDTMPTPAPLHPDHLAYVLYTSGSTGYPKGVAIEHRNAVNLLYWGRSLVEPDELTGVLFSTSLNFDLSVYELFLPLAFGGRVIVVENLLAVATAPARAAVRLVNSIPSLMDALLAEQGLPPCTSMINLAGEPLSRGLVDRLFAAASGARVFNCYGPTETTTYSTWSRVDSAERAPPSIGRGVRNTQLFVLDADLQPVPVGVPGELYIGGAGVARGYLHKPDLTAERFLTNPHGAGRIYRTGDLVRWRGDGGLDFIGRADAQVKINGLRIELGEIENQLASIPGIAAAAATVRQDSSGVARLLAFAVPRDRASAPSFDEIRARLERKLPRYMVPLSLNWLESLPQTPNGKLDRRALPEPSAEHRVKIGMALPRTPTEVSVAAIWAEALSVDRVGIHDDFIALGGHSLIAVRVCARLRDSLNIPLGITDLLAAHTVATLAAEIDAMQRANGASSVPVIQAVARDRTLPTAMAQDALLFFHELSPDNLAYNIQVTIRLLGDLNVVVLEHALAEIVRRHEVLRTTFARVEGDWRQIIHPPWRVSLPIIEDAPGRLPSLYKQQLDPTRLPLVQWTLVRSGPRDHVLVHLQHHLVHDGWSIGVFVQELAAIYTAYHAGRVSPLPDLPVQFADFAVWQRSMLRGEVLKSLVSYWQEQLAGASPVLQLITDHSRPSLQTFRGEEVQAELPLPLSIALRALARANGCSLFNVMLAGFAVLLRRYTEQDDIIIGSGYANRERKECEGLIGMFANMLPLRINLAGDPSFTALVERVQAVALEALAHQALPFEAIIRSTEWKRDPSRNPLCQVAFNFHDFHVPAVQLPGLFAEIAYPHNGSAKFDMNVSVFPWAEQRGNCPTAEPDEHLTIKWDFNTDLFEIATVEQMLTQYVRVLEAAAAHPEIPISNIEMIDDAERRRLAAWNDTGRDYPRELSIQALFEAQAHRTPDATALIFGDVALSYSALNARANRMAHFLGRLGVRPEEKVGLLVERSIEMVIAILGILKAGGAYIPLDPDHPRSRLEFMLRDTEAQILVTQEHLRKLIPNFGGRVVCIDAKWPTIEREGTENPLVEVRADHLAYVMYTSGSTGTPKGVCIEHRSVVRLVKNTDYASLGPEETMLLAAPSSFDAATFELWGSLLNGGRLVIFPTGVLSLEALARAIRDHEISTLWLTTALFNQMVDFHLDALVGVRQLITGGDVLSVLHARRVLDALPPGHRLLNAYGPTENTTFTSVHIMTRDSRIGRSVPIGKPIANTQVYILDERQRPSPLGAPGELCIAGDGLAREYLNQRELTAEKFAVAEGRRLYRSGDKARYLADGSIEFLGRTDDQVKFRGYRIELGEIESVLSRHTSLRDCTVLLRGTTSMDKRLVAYVMGRDGTPAAAQVLRDFLSESLPAYMVPSDFVVVDAWPLTPTGKVDRMALPSPQVRSPRPRDGHIAPRNWTEQVLAEIWAKYLGHQDFGVDNDFFEAGGHSLAAAGMFAEIGVRCGVSLPLALLFQKPTIAALAQEIAEETKHSRSSHLISVQPAGSKPPIFALFGVGGSYAAYAVLAKELGPDQPFYSFEMPGLEGESVPLERIEAVASRFLHEIRRVQAREPCVLIGACAGALVVYELAHYLEAEGRAVKLVVLMDPPATGGGSRFRRLSFHRVWRRLVLPRFLLGRVGLHLKTIMTLHGDGRSTYVKQKLSILREILSKRDLFRASRHEFNATRVLEATSAAITAFVPQPYAGRVALLLGERYEPGESRDPALEWRKLCTGPLEVLRVSGQSTGAMLKQPHVRAWVARLNEILNFD